MVVVSVHYSRSRTLKAWAFAMAFSASPYSPCPKAGRVCTDDLLQGSVIPGQLLGFFLEGLTAVAGGGAVHEK